MTFSRRALLGTLASLPLLRAAPALAQQGSQFFTSPIRLAHRRVWVDVHIGGQGPLPFIIDTGVIVSLVQPATVRELRLRSVGNVRLVGTGGPQLFDLYEGRDIVFGGAIRQSSAVFAAPRERLGLGPDSAGAVAAGMITALDSDLDFEASEWRVYPNGRGERSGFELLPSEFTEGGGQQGSPRIYVDAAIDGRTYRLLVDTGMPGQLSLMPGATRRSGLWNDQRPYAPIQPRGIGGEAGRGRLVRAGQVSLGGISFDRPLVALNDPRGSNHAGMDGIIGLELLERLTLSTDARARRLWAKRNARPPQPERYGMSGIWTDERHGVREVVAVSPGSPAAEAGVRLGDRLPGVSLEQVIALLGGPPGQPVELRLRRGSEDVVARFNLRPFL